MVRKTQASLRDSCFALFKSILYDWKIGEQCKFNKTNLEIEFPNGSRIIFKGLDDAEKIKSIADISDILSIYLFLPQQFLYFLPDPHGHGSLRPILAGAI